MDRRKSSKEKMEEKKKLLEQIDRGHFGVVQRPKRPRSTSPPASPPSRSPDIRRYVRGQRPTPMDAEYENEESDMS